VLLQLAGTHALNAGPFLCPSEAGSRQHNLFHGFRCFTLFTGCASLHPWLQSLAPVGADEVIAIDEWRRPRLQLQFHLSGPGQYRSDLNGC
jgi:hypothetical protein